jgi:hypothetical protein
MMRSNQQKGEIAVPTDESRNANTPELQATSSMFCQMMEDVADILCDGNPHDLLTINMAKRLAAEAPRECPNCVSGNFCAVWNRLKKVL